MSYFLSQHFAFLGEQFVCFSSNPKMVNSTYYLVFQHLFRDWRMFGFCHVFVTQKNDEFLEVFVDGYPRRSWDSAINVSLPRTLSFFRKPIKFVNPAPFLLVLLVIFLAALLFRRLSVSPCPDSVLNKKFVPQG